MPTGWRLPRRPDFRNTGWGGGWSFGRLVWSMPDGRRLCVLVRKPPRLGPGSLPCIREGLGGFYLEVMASLRLLSVADMPTQQLRSEVCFRLHLRSRGRRGGHDPNRMWNRFNRGPPW